MDIPWEGNVKDLVDAVAASDARTRYVDSKTGAKISINISDVEEEGYEGVFEPFYIEHSDNLYDAYNRKEAVMILSNIRKGKKFPDMPSDAPKRKPRPKTAKRKSKSKRKPQRADTSIRMIR